MAEQFNSLEDLFLHELKDLYDAEHQITKALPKMIGATKNAKLKKAFEDHLSETEGQIERLEQVFKLCKTEPERETCQAMKGLVKEGDSVVKAKGDEEVIDAALIAAAQRVEHYEMAGYGTLRTLAQRLGKNKVADLLQETLDEEKSADKKLTKIAVSTVNAKAAG